jgi:AAA15 family ATPase/GTPase
MQKIYINNLGAVKDFSMDVNEFNILIGEQATGKSTISKSIYFFRSFKSEILEYLYLIAFGGTETDKKFPNALNAKMKDVFIKLFGYSWDLDEKLSMKYEFTDDIWIELKLNKSGRGKKYINIQCSPKLIEQINALEDEALKINNDNKDIALNIELLNTERLRIHSYFKERINCIFQDDLETYYIPAGRSLLTLMTNQKTKMDYESIDYVNRKFMQFIESIQTKFENGVSKVHLFYPKEKRKFDVTKVSKSIVENVKGEYSYTKGQEYLLINHGENKIRINYASSGQQEVLWLFNQLYILLLMEQKSFVIIEEPEAHLYPTLQKEVVEFISFFKNSGNNKVLVTTHSPYILTTANMLYCAGKLSDNKVESILGKYKTIEPKAFNAIKLKSSDLGTEAESLIDEDLNEIRTELIDEISDEINEKYSSIFFMEEWDDGITE